jgi:FMN phosphatase YigB (HAD superfamily)
MIQKVQPISPVNNIQFENYYYTSKKKYSIMVDLDGTLCDFDLQFLKYVKETPEDFIYKYGMLSFERVILKYGNEFWSNMPWLIEGKQLWNYIKKYYPTILSAPINYESCYSGKQEWVEKHLGKQVSYIFDKDKEKYARPDVILIDDRIENVKKFRERGGEAILFTDSRDVIKKLKQDYNM